MLIFGKHFDLSPDEMSTAATIVWATIGLTHLYNVSRPLNIAKLLIFGISLAGLVICISQLKWWFGIAELGPIGAKITVGGIFMGEVIFWAIKKAFRGRTRSRESP